MTQDRLTRYAPRSATFLTVGPSEDLTGDRSLVPVAPLVGDDGGADGEYTLGVSGATESERGVVKLAGQLGGTADEPSVVGLTVFDTSVATPLTLGEVKHGEVLVRDGDEIVGVPVLNTAGGSMEGDLDMGGHVITGLADGTDATDAVAYGQVSPVIRSIHWQPPVIDSTHTSPPGSPTTGARYLVLGTGTGDWAGHTGDVAEWNGTAWAFTPAVRGFAVNSQASGVNYLHSGTAWGLLADAVDHASLLNLNSGDPHPQYQKESEKDANDGYAGLDSNGLLIRPVKAIRTSGDPAGPVSGDVWINGADLKFRNGVGTPATETVERQIRRNANDGYAGLDSSGNVPVAHGGTGANFSATGQGAIPYFSGTGVIGALSAGTAGQALRTLGAANPQWVWELVAKYLFGDGSDGTVDLDGTNTYGFVTTTGSSPNYAYTLNRDVFATTLTVRSGKILKTGNFSPYAHSLVVESGAVISHDGADANGTTGGAGLSANGSANASSAAGPNGRSTNGPGTGGGASSVSLGGSGGAGGSATGQSGGSAGSAATPSAAAGGANWLGFAVTRRLLSGTSFTSANGGASGGAGGCNVGTGSAVSGGGGGGGGVMFLYARVLSNSGTIRANGGAGGNATATGDGSAGGGGGGGGGSVILVAAYAAATGTVQASGGAGGTGAGGGGTGTAGTAGKVYLFGA